MEWGQRMRSERPTEMKLTKESNEGWTKKKKKRNPLPPRSFCNKIWTSSGRHGPRWKNWIRREWSLLCTVLVMAVNVNIPACLHWSSGLWCMHIGKVYWQKMGHIHHKSTGRNSWNEPESPQEALIWNHNLWIQVVSKATLQIGSAFFPPTTCISNIFLLGRTALAPSEQADEEAGMCMKEQKEQQTDESTMRHSWLL